MKTEGVSKITFINYFEESLELINFKNSFRVLVSLKVPLNPEVVVVEFCF